MYVSVQCFYDQALVPSTVQHIEYQRCAALHNSSTKLQNIYHYSHNMTMTPNKRIKTSDSDTTQKRLPTTTIATIHVPTFPDKKVTKLNLLSIEEEHLKLLKQRGKIRVRVLPILLFLLHSYTATILSRIASAYYVYVYVICYALCLTFCETDPFLYYSIPEVNKATLSLNEVDLSKASQTANAVTRKTRIAFECHPSLVIDELFVGLGSEESESEFDLGELDVGDFGIELLYKTQ